MSRLNGAKRIELPLFPELSAVCGGFVFVLVQRRVEYEQSQNASEKNRHSLTLIMLSAVIPRGLCV